MCFQFGSVTIGESSSPPSTTSKTPRASVASRPTSKARCSRAARQAQAPPATHSSLASPPAGQAAAQSAEVAQAAPDRAEGARVSWSARYARAKASQWPGTAETVSVPASQAPPKRPALKSATPSGPMRVKVGCRLVPGPRTPAYLEGPGESKRTASPASAARLASSWSRYPRARAQVPFWVRQSSSSAVTAGSAETPSPPVASPPARAYRLCAIRSAAAVTAAASRRPAPVSYGVWYAGST
mmetsp:Transcript_26671/g.46501  ORF Transcript_26671/g.46501 Transcript_26671/m.46501 type:complete len:242 (-) Transcript_26671:700-1425(-)